MEPALLAVTSAFLFGAMTVALRIALQRGAEAEAGAFLTVLVAFLVVLPFALVAGGELAGAWPFLLAGVLGPGASQVLFTLGVRDAGASRASVVVGTAPLFAVAIALVFLDEPLEAGLVVGALLIVGGGIALASERRRPERFRAVGLVYALAPPSTAGACRSCRRSSRRSRCGELRFRRWLSAGRSGSASGSSPAPSSWSRAAS